MRMIWFTLMSLVAGLFAFIGSTMPFMLRSQAAEDQGYYDQFRTTAADIERNGEQPDVEILLKRDRGPNEVLILSAPTKPSDCDPSFEPAKSDRFVLWFWRGEWRECYAHPSGRTSLPLTVQAYLRAGLGRDLLIYWLIAAAAAWGAIRLRPRKVV